MEVLEYKTFEHTKVLEGQFATLDAVANISSQLTTLGLKFNEDWFLAEVYYNSDGEQVITIEMPDAKKALLVKVRGIK